MSETDRPQGIVVTGETTTAQIVPNPSQGVPLESLPDRVAAIEARQRDYGMHDPGCPERTEEKHLAKHFENWPTIPRPKCTCWLSKEPTT